MSSTPTSSPIRTSTVSYQRSPQPNLNPSPSLNLRYVRYLGSEDTILRPSLNPSPILRNSGSEDTIANPNLNPSHVRNRRSARYFRSEDTIPSPSLNPRSTRYFGSKDTIPFSTSSVFMIPTVIVSDPPIICAICIDNFSMVSDVRKLPCCCIFHFECIAPWLSAYNSCPLCRRLVFTCMDEKRSRLLRRIDRAARLEAELSRVSRAREDMNSILVSRDGEDMQE